MAGHRVDDMKMLLLRLRLLRNRMMLKLGYTDTSYVDDMLLSMADDYDRRVTDLAAVKAAQEAAYQRTIDWLQRKCTALEVIVMDQAADRERINDTIKVGGP